MSLSTSAAHNSSPAIRHVTKSGRQANYCDLFIKLYFDNATKGRATPQHALSCGSVHSHAKRSLRVIFRPPLVQVTPQVG